MHIGIPKETRDGETRVAATPETVKKYTAGKHTVVVERGAGVAARYLDEAYGPPARPWARPRMRWGRTGAEGARAFRRELPHMKPGAVVAGMLDPFDAEGLMRLAAAGLTGFALEAAPHHARAEPGRAVVPGQPGRLQGRAAGGALLRPPLSHDDDRRRHAQGRARRGAGRGRGGPAGHRHRQAPGRGGQASDVRPRAREQVESLGAKFIDVPFETDEEREIAQGVGGYARPMPPSWMARQAALVSERCKQADIIITTALIPGRPAPRWCPPRPWPA